MYEEDSTLKWEMYEAIPARVSIEESVVYLKTRFGVFQLELRHHDFVFDNNGKKNLQNNTKYHVEKYKHM